MDTSVLRISSHVSSSLDVYDLEGVCEECVSKFMGSILPGKYIDLYLTSISSHLLHVQSRRSKTTLAQCHKFWPKEYGMYSLNITQKQNVLQCGEIKFHGFEAKHETDIVPFPLVVIISTFLLLYFFPFLIRCFYERLKLGKLLRCCLSRLKCKTTLIYYPQDNTQVELIINPDKHNEDNLERIRIDSVIKPKPKEFQTFDTQIAEKKDRLVSLDTFRGLAVTLMMFVNAGGGGYWYFNHAFWSGMTFADLPHPWFNWIMGVSIVLGRASEKPSLNTYERFRIIFERVAKLFIVGFTMNSIAFTQNLKRIPALGVPQDLAILYLGGILLHIYTPRPKRGKILDLQQSCERNFVRRILPLKEYLAFWPLSASAAIASIISLMLTFGIDVPGCGRGYFGPGGERHLGGRYKNCTGGAFSYFDQKIIGPDHMQFGLAFQGVYDTDGLQDSYGIAEIPGQFVQVIFGILAGEILLLYKHLPSVVMLKWIGTSIIWGLLTLLFCNPVNCILPLNRRIWSLSCILYSSGISTIILTILYFLVDVKKIWNGKPFYYPGVNSMALFVGQYSLKHVFPFFWKSPKSHVHLTFMHLWQTTLWILISIYMYKKKIFIRM